MKPGKCPIRNEKVIDSGQFVAKLAKTGEGVVTEAFASEGTQTERIAFTPPKETKKSVCPVTKGGLEAKCRVQLTSAPSGDSLALRLCKTKEAPGLMLPVVSAVVAQEKAHAFCACKESRDPVACATELGAQPEISKRKSSR